MGLGAHSYPDEENEKKEDKADHATSHLQLSFILPPHHNHKGIDRNQLVVRS